MINNSHFITPVYILNIILLLIMSCEKKFKNIHFALMMKQFNKLIYSCIL